MSFANTRFTLLAIILFAAPEAHVAAAELPKPAGDPVLLVSGSIARTNAPEGARFDVAMLEALPAVTFETSTLWTDGVHSYTGVPLVVLLDAVAATGSSVTAKAINDYAVEIPVDDASTDGPIIAYAADGAPMKVRDKGPLWILYPYDSDPAFRTEVAYSRSVWQLDRLVVNE